MMCGENEVALILQEHEGIIGIADLASAFDNCSQCRTDVGRRGGDHLQDVAASGLIDQRFGEIVRALAQLPEQAGVLDRDHGLIGEGCDQPDLLVIEWNGLAPAHADRAHHLVSREHRIEQQGVKVKFTRVLLRYRGTAGLPTNGWNCTVRFSSIAMPPTDSPESARGYRCLSRRSTPGSPSAAAISTMSSLSVWTMAKGASNRRRRLLAMASNTGLVSFIEPLMEERISAVAVCCSSDSCRSRVRASTCSNSPTFEIAMTAWSANTSIAWI